MIKGVLIDLGGRRRGQLLWHGNLRATS